MTTPTTGARKAPRRRIKKTDWGYRSERGADVCFIIACTAFAVIVLILLYAVAEEAWNHLDDPEHPFSGFAPDCPTDFSHYEHIRNQYHDAF